MGLDMTLDQILDSAAASGLAFLNATVDVERRLHDLLQEVGIDPASIPPRGITTGQQPHQGT